MKILFYAVKFSRIYIRKLQVNKCMCFRHVKPPGTIKLRQNTPKQTCKKKTVHGTKRSIKKQRRSKTSTQNRDFYF